MISDFYYLDVFPDMRYSFKEGMYLGRHSKEGTWRQEENIIKLHPDDSDNLLHWICSDYELRIFENYLIGRTFNDEDQVEEYHYLIGIIPLSNKR